MPAGNLRNTTDPTKPIERKTNTPSMKSEALKRANDPWLSSITTGVMIRQLVTDPMRDQLTVVGEHAAALGYVPKADASGLVDDSLLKEIAAPGVGGSGQGD